MRDVDAAKQAIRKRVLARRKKLGPAELRANAVAIAGVLLGVPEVARAAVVALYVGVGSEPGTGPLLDELSERGVRVLLPLVTPDRDLDWAAYSGPDDLAPARMGLLEPTTPSLGRFAIHSADCVLVPGLAADRTGLRLGRGAGCYDRALTRVPDDVFTCLLLHDGEILDEPLPAAAHDQRVDAAATPSGLVRFPLPASAP